MLTEVSKVYNCNWLLALRFRILCAMMLVMHHWPAQCTVQLCCVCNDCAPRCVCVSALTCCCCFKCHCHSSLYSSCWRQWTLLITSPMVMAGIKFVCPSVCLGCISSNNCWMYLHWDRGSLCPGHFVSYLCVDCAMDPMRGAKNVIFLGGQ